MAGKKTRIAVISDNNIRELFSIQENSQGGLTIVVKHSPPLADSIWHPVEQRYSVHESKNSADGGFLIKETTRTVSKQTIERFAYVKPNGDAALLPIFGQICAIMPVQPEISLRQTNDMMMLYMQDIIGSLFYIVVVARSGLTSRDLSGVNLQIRELKFQRYTVFIASGIFPNIGRDGGVTLPIISAPPKIDGVVEDWALPADFPEPVSPLAEWMPLILSNIVDDLAAVAKWQLRTQAAATGLIKNIFEAADLSRYYDQYRSHPNDLLPRDRVPSPRWFANFNAVASPKPDRSPHSPVSNA